MLLLDSIYPCAAFSAAATRYSEAVSYTHLLPDAISALPAGVFGDCSRLTSVHLPEQLQACLLYTSFSDLSLQVGDRALIAGLEGGKRGGAGKFSVRLRPECGYSGQQNIRSES